MTALFTLPGQVAFKSGVFAPGAKLYFRQTGTSTPQNTYTTEALSVASANPVIADSNGVFEAIYLDPSLPSYRVILTDSSDVQIQLWDGVPSNQSTGTAFNLTSTNPYIKMYDTDGTANLRKYKISGNGSQLLISMLNDAEKTETTILSYQSGTTVLGGAVINDAFANTIRVGTSGSFTGTLTGMTGATTGTVLYETVGNLVYLYLTAGITGTSNTTSMTMTGLPSACQTTHAHDAFCTLTDNSNALMSGMATVLSSTITFNLAKTNGVANFVQNSTTNFTNSGTKGLGATWSICYLKS